ncbi:MAG TPA: hypothetical protein VMT15_03110 [Bryobacteraceae bacterium]|nr:hypothetical protein [Bryobacteraceae bacterium]
MRLIRVACLWALAAGGLGFAQPVITSVLDPYTGGSKLSPGGQAVITGSALGINPSVTVGGVNAFNLVPPQNGPQIVIEIPVNAPVGSNIPVIVTTGGGGPSAPFNITLTQYAPVLINTPSGALTSPRHQSTGVAVTASTPAAAGEPIVFYAIGLGPVTTPVNTGAPAPPNDATTTAPAVTLGGNAVPGATARLANGQAFFGASYSGPMAGSTQAFFGIYIVSFNVPPGTASGSYAVALTIGGATSNSVMLSVGTAAAGLVITAVVGPTGKTALCPGDQAIISGLNLGANPAVAVGGKAAFTINAPNNGNQMTVQIPVDAPLGQTTVVLTLGTGPASAPFLITLTQYAPVIPINGGTNPPYHLTSQAPVTAANPAVPGEQILVLAFGLGPTNPVVPTGTTAPNNPPAITVTTPTVNIGGAAITTGITAGANSYQIGSYYVIFTVPQNQPAGGAPVWLSIGGLTSNLTTMQVFVGPTITNVTNAASNIGAGLPNAGIAQGAIFTIYGLNLGPGTISVAQNAFQATSLSGTSISVTVNGTTVAPLLYYTSATQVSALLPSNTPVGTGTITVTYNGQVGLAAPITVVASNFGIFTVTSDGQGAGIVTNADYSLVSVSRASNCGGPYTTCGAANPGDTLILWGTGLGPVNGSDAGGAGLGVNMSNLPLTLWLGGVQANVLYQGRSGCCIGEDQVVFTVPANSPTGCAVPLVAQIGNEISNYTVMPVAPAGSRTCTATNPTFTSALVQGLTTNTGPLTHGEIDVARFPNQDAQGNVSTTANTDSGSSQFLSFTVPPAVQPFMATYLDDLPAGTCAVYNSLSGFNGGNYLTNFKQLDGGPSVKVTGPNGIQNIPTNGKNVALAPGTFLSPGAYTFAGTGGADVASFSAPFTIPAPPTLTSPASGPNIAVTRADGITLTWSGGAGNSIIQIQGGNSTDNTGSLGASFTCFAAASAGTFTIPPGVLLALPPGAFYGSVWNFVSYTYGTFSVPGLNHTAIQTNYATPIFTTLK